MHFTCRPPDGDSCWCKKTSGPRKVYGRTAFCLDLCKHFSSELMDSVTHSGSYWIKKTESLGDYMFQKAAHWLTTCQSLVINKNKWFKKKSKIQLGEYSSRSFKATLQDAGITQWIEATIDRKVVAKAWVWIGCPTTLDVITAATAIFYAVYVMLLFGWIIINNLRNHFLIKKMAFKANMHFSKWPTTFVRVSLVRPL